MIEFKFTVKVHCGNLLYETISVSVDLNITVADVDKRNLTEASNDTMVDKYQMLIQLLKDTKCNDQVCTQFQETLTPSTGMPPKYQYQDRNGSTYDLYVLFLTDQGSVSKLVYTEAVS